MFSGEILHSRTDIFQREFDFLRFSLFRLSPKTANLFLWLSYGGVCFSYCAVHTVHTLAWKSASWDNNKVVLFTRCNCKGSNSHEISQNTTTGKPPHLQATDLYPPRNAQKFIVYTREANEQPNHDDDVIVHLVLVVHEIAHHYYTAPPHASRYVHPKTSTTQQQNHFSRTAHTTT